MLDAALEAIAFAAAWKFELISCEGDFGACLFFVFLFFWGGEGGYLFIVFFLGGGVLVWGWGLPFHTLVWSEEFACFRSALLAHADRVPR